MLISIAERLKPYSHRPGTRFVLPGSSTMVDVFPALLRFDDSEMPLDIIGPVENFTAELDLEHGYLKVWGHAVNGYFRYRLYAKSEGGVTLIWEKGPLTHDNPVPIPNAPADTERLSLGCHKAQDWARVSERLALGEIFPFWFRMGRLLPEQPTARGTGTTKLLFDCKKVMEFRETLKLPAAFRTLFRAGFEGVLAPRLCDGEHQGLALPAPHAAESVMALLSDGAKLIREIFIQSHAHQVHLLPLLPAELHCGRMLNVACGHSFLDMEWSKKTIRRVIFRCKETASWQFNVLSDIRQFRVRYGNRDRGRIIPCGTPLELLAGRDYFFDNFRR